MKAFIDDAGKRVYVEPLCPPDAALFMGLRFGKEYAALVDEGWNVYIAAVPTYPAPWREVNIEGAHSLAEKIREGPPKCPQCGRPLDG